MIKPSGYIILTCILISSCNRIKNRTKSISKSIERSINNQKEIIKDEIINSIDIETLESKPISFNEFFKIDSLVINHNNGVWFDMPFAFHYCFLKYNTDKVQLLNFISELKSSLPNISDSTYQVSDSIEIYEKIHYFQSNYPENYNQIYFFDSLKEIDNLEYYKCTKYPNVHLFAYDNSKKTMYHFFEKYWD